jgi:ABC-type transport system involved in cytochrome c biogenesis ATPase subunit/GNAT superfamily N-acetyltransferase
MLTHVAANRRGERQMMVGEGQRVQAQLVLPSAPRVVRVTDVNSTGPLKKLSLANKTCLAVHRFAAVGKRDEVSVSGDGRVWASTDDGEVLVVPPFTLEAKIEVVQRKTLSVLIHEITDQSHLDAYEALAQYHYRSSAAFGRRSILLMSSRTLRFPRCLGFIEITTPFMHAKNRSRLFNAPFSEPGRTIAWDAWDQSVKARFINCVARVSRMVVHPEMRGLGLSRWLIQAAERFCLERWQVDGVRPLFLEITADMLKFTPFAASAHMRWIGDSAGNFDRIQRDMEYLSDIVRDGRDHWINRPETAGIGTRQRKDAVALAALQTDLGARGVDVYKELGKIARGEPTDSDLYEKLFPLIRFPKPTYMKGLTTGSSSFLQRRCYELGLAQGVVNHDETARACSGPLVIQDLTLDFEIDSGDFRQSDTGRIRQAFGLSRRFRFRTGINSLNVRIEPGQVCLVYGASGAGKTQLLRLIGAANDRYSRALPYSGRIVMPSDARIATLKDLPAVPLVKALGDVPLVQGIRALNSAGLAEPRLYLSMYDDLSAGQKYRAQLARLVVSDSNVWLLDEFASNLDVASGMAVARQFSKAARRRGAICIVASVRRDEIVNALEPNVVIHLDQVNGPSVYHDWRSWLGTK